MPFPLDLQSLTGPTILVGLIITAALVVLIPDWRLALLALTIQYVLLAGLLTTIVQPQVASVRVIAGAVAVSILYLTLHSRMREDSAARRQAREHPDQVFVPLERPPVFVVTFPFRLFAVALVSVAIIGLSSSVSFLGLATPLLFGSLWLMAVGVLVAMLSRDVARLGIGILLFTGGFSILDTAIEGSLFLYGLLNLADLLIALAVAHLATLPSEGSTSRRRGDLL